MVNKILLACSGGFSTSMLVQKMKEAAEQKGLAIEILAVGEDNIFEHLDSDVLLLGPQIGHKLEDLSEELDFPVFVIDMMDYGTMNGEKVLSEILEKI
ncbi:MULTISPECIES: PTS sugar transporter subunit IIB [unclassified Breznakia]|uniref:PTS sugar transporter subunit IIB n=1 Tax=unclassified Breznakia TaxID=2623764 RepID=UPI002474267C|nr:MULTISPECIES: PTS sugar transporter subunit IIB [unclassified Breznakia]MDH6366635.1 PTS system cellobiose-specific IIB component [Breznakia sp. PH1-1]MDH6403728.1 PTS system cellobiose-specific IIB component [Breznakia sp. PF1-11]MDH6411437.1 PTS system cellobiose-specific IIB component [Breznakia sp. PFB1-11]MDH6413832.1 PTS system cellobiose-specific IIB component [Breznakia sp. PFB1-14]MDH6416262.1 PTS system cellobiose-specific IIB component [Breznakia sp. PFB1-4]